MYNLFDLLQTTLSEVAKYWDSFLTYYIADHSLPSTTALVAAYSKVSHLHKFLPLSLSDHSLSVDYVLSAFANSSLEPSVDSNDDPLWADALASPK